MTRTLLLGSLTVTLLGCVVPQHTMIRSNEPNPLAEIRLDPWTAYLIDPRTETCLLERTGTSSAFAVTVSCAKLKAALPESAPFITWTEATLPPR